eukprot:6360585-Alexandrium_andersonii.AAC.1
MLRSWWRHWRRGGRTSPTIGSSLWGRALGHQGALDAGTVEWLRERWLPADPNPEQALAGHRI